MDQNIDFDLFYIVKGTFRNYHDLPNYGKGKGLILNNFKVKKY
jgi:hypothetical protein